ncbi:MAG: polysaccharide deacetylase family protein [Nitrospirae bacterium]|nr:polysaccharide deacetylase family protein [Nitrospirota bacterium]
MKLFAFTIDLEADYGGVVNQYEIFKDPEKIEEVLSTLHSIDVKITVFTVGEIFELFPGIIKIFEKYDCEFEVHSYSHNLNCPDSEIEIEKSRGAYFNYFNRYPAGYRAPQGRISFQGIKLLEKHGFLYDSSIFPSYFPNPFRYLFHNKQIHFHSDFKILEIPLTSVSPFRLTLSISYIKLLGIRLFKKPALPEVICFDSHLHDFIHNEKSFGQLPLFWKMIYSRNKFMGMNYCKTFLEQVKREGYRFCYMSEIYNLHMRSGVIKTDKGEQD